MCLSIDAAKIYGWGRPALKGSLEQGVVSNGGPSVVHIGYLVSCARESTFNITRPLGAPGFRKHISY
jgi:hypothetical protein